MQGCLRTLLCNHFYSVLEEICEVLSKIAKPKGVRSKQLGQNHANGISTGVLHLDSVEMEELCGQSLRPL